MIRDALEYIVGMGDAPLITPENQPHREFRKEGYEEILPKRPEPVTVSTLEALRDLLEFEPSDYCMVHVVSPAKVCVRTKLTEHNMRYVPFQALPMIDTCFNFDNWMTQDAFVTSAQTHFLDTLDRAKMLEVVGNVTSGWNATLKDDGVTQKVNIGKGIVSQAQEVLPNPVRLQAYETFPEISQPIRAHILRIQCSRDENSPPSFRLIRVPDPTANQAVVTEIGIWLNAHVKLKVIA